MRVATDVVAISVLVFLARFAGRGLRAAADVVVDVAALRTVLGALAPAFAAVELMDLVARFALPAATGFAALFVARTRVADLEGASAAARCR